MSEKQFENLLKMVISLMIIVSAVEIGIYLIKDTLFTLMIIFIIGLIFGTFLTIHKVWKD